MTIYEFLLPKNVFYMDTNFTSFHKHYPVQQHTIPNYEKKKIGRPKNKCLFAVIGKTRSVGLFFFSHAHMVHDTFLLIL